MQHFLPKNKSHQIFSYSKVNASMSVPDSEVKILSVLLLMSQQKEVLELQTALVAAYHL